MHEILAAAFEVLHFERFLDKEEDVEEIIDIINLEITNIETDCRVYSKEADRYLIGMTSSVKKLKTKPMEKLEHCG